MMENHDVVIDDLPQSVSTIKDNLITPTDKINLSQPPAMAENKKYEHEEKDTTLELVGTETKSSPLAAVSSPFPNCIPNPESSSKSMDYCVTKRLIFSPSGADSPAISTIQTEELSSFYISPVAATNDGYSIRSVGFSEILPYDNLFSAIQQPSIVDNSITDIIVSNDNIMDTKQPQEEQKTKDLNLNTSAMDEDVEMGDNSTKDINNETIAGSNRPVRKRKPTVFYDGDKVQPKKQRTPRAKKAACATTESPSTLSADASKKNDAIISIENELAVALSDDGEEVMDARDVEEYTPGQENGKKKRVRVSKKAAVLPAASSTEEYFHEVAVVANPPETIVVPPEVQLKIGKYNERIVELANELHSIEKHVDFVDTNLDLDELTDEVDRFLIKPVGVEFLSEVIDFKRVAAAKAAAKFATKVVGNPKSTDIIKSSEAKGEEEATETAKDTMDVVDMTESEIPAVVSAEREAPHEEEQEEEYTIVLSDQALAQACFGYIRSVIIRCIQGHSCGLSSLVEPVIQKLTLMVQYLQSKLEFDPSIVRVRDAMLQQMQSLGDSVALETEMKLCAERVSYGIRNPVKQELFDNVDNECIWRWEVHALPSFRDVSQKLIKETRLLRNRYSRAIKSALALIQHLQKKFDDNTKTLSLEERVVKNLAEIEKFKEKRREMEMKRQHELEEKLRREEMKEKKRKEKEEADLLKKQQLEEAAAAKAAAKAALQAEKDRKKAEEDAKKAEELAKKAEEEAKKQQKLQKQKSFFTSFFKPGAAATSTAIEYGSTSANTASPSSVKTSSSACSETVVFASDAATAAGGQIKNASNDPSQLKTKPVATIDLAADEERHHAFIASLTAGMSLTDIQCSYVARHNAKVQAKKQLQQTQKPRRSKLITVPVEIAKLSTSSAGAFGEDNSFIEIEHRTFRNRVNTYTFCEDNRPAYVGTWSKKSRVISGRRPFAQDHELLRYDYDSEEEWEEEGEGEDIAMSDGSRDEEDDEEGGNELEYDDFFRHDNDFGSDVDSDEEGMVCMHTALPVSLAAGKMKEECVGPCFVVNAHWQGMSGTVVGTEGYLTLDRACASGASHYNLATQAFESNQNDEESLKLAHYTSVVFTPANMRLVTTTPAVTPNMNSSSSSSSAQKDAGNNYKAGVTTSSKKKKAKAVADAPSLETTAVGDVDTNAQETSASVSPSSAAKFMKRFDETKLGDLIQLVHGSKDGIDKLVNAFTEKNAHVSKAQTKKRFLEIAEKKKHADGYGSLRWVVKDEILSISEFNVKTVEYTPMKATAIGLSAKKRITPSVVSAFSAVTASVAKVEKPTMGEELEKTANNETATADQNVYNCPESNVQYVVDLVE